MKNKLIEEIDALKKQIADKETGRDGSNALTAEVAEMKKELAQLRSEQASKKPLFKKEESDDNEEAESDDSDDSDEWY